MLDLKDRLQATLGSKYSIERVIGAGGMATVYLARDLKHDREVALKVLRPELSAVLGTDRFLNEIGIAAQLDHPHILTLIDSGEADGLLYYLLPYVRGESLRKRLDRERQLSVDEALAITRQIASALDYAHAKGVVHRDVKPENILIHEGEAILTDFGIATAVKQAGGNRLTETGLSLGTPQYMSPEQATGDRTLDARSDVYSLAAVLYEMLAGEPPHTGPTSQAVIAKLMTERPTPLRVVRDTVPEGVNTAVARALAKVPADRYSNAGDFARALESSAPRPRSIVRRWWLPLTAGVAALVVLAMIANATRNRRSASTVTPKKLQLTSNGNAYYPSLSPDGNRMALFEKDCDAQERCSYQLVVQDIDGTGRLVLANRIATIWGTEWTPDSRFIVYGAAYSDSWGVYAVPTLGGSPRRLGCCTAYAITADTIMVVPTSTRDDSVVWVRYVTIRDGTVRDSVPVRDPRFDFQGFPTDDPAIFGATVYLPGQPAELRLINRKGTVVSKYQMGANGATRARRLAGQGALVGLQQDGWKLIRVRIANGKFESAADTLVTGLELTTPNAEGYGWFSIAPDLSQLVFGYGPYESSVWRFDIEGASRPSNTARLLTATSWAWPRISRDGRSVAIGRTVSTSRGPRDELFLIDNRGLRQVTPPLEDIRAIEWKADGSGVLLLYVASAEQMAVLEVDTSGLRSREIMRVNRSDANDMRTLRDGTFILIDASFRHLRHFDRTGRFLKQWDTPPALPFFQGVVSGWSDGRRLALSGFDKGSIHLVVVQLDMQTGRFSPPIVFPADKQGWGLLTWLDDERLVMSVLEAQGRWGLYQIMENGAIRKLAQLPQLAGPLHTTWEYTISGDGRHFSAAVLSTRSDVYSIRNFGDLLKQ
jgi:serine/threonine protein kinase